MARYRKVDPRVWNDEKFSTLSERSKLVFLFVLTHPHMTSLGAMRATIPGMAAELQMDLKAFREAFGEVFRKALVEHDEIASYVGLPNFLKYNGPESPNVVKSWTSALDLIPECRHKYMLMQRVKGFAEGLGEGFREALPEAFRKGMPNQEQEQEQEQKQNTNKCVSTKFVPPTAVEVWAYCHDRKNGIDGEQFVDYYAARGWKMTNGKLMVDWKAAVRTWEKNNGGKTGSHAKGREQDRVDRNLSVLERFAADTPGFRNSDGLPYRIEADNGPV